MSTSWAVGGPLVAAVWTLGVVAVITAQAPAALALAGVVGAVLTFGLWALAATGAAR